jgi:hypothetical protein
MDLWTNDKAKAMWELMGDVMGTFADGNQDNVREVQEMFKGLIDPGLHNGADALIRLIREIRNFSIPIYGPMP